MTRFYDSIHRKVRTKQDMEYEKFTRTIMKTASKGHTEPMPQLPSETQCKKDLERISKK